MIHWALIAAAGSGLLAVVLGAFGAHGLEQTLGEKGADVFATALRYHFVHTLALALAALAPVAGAERRACRWACGLWLAGLVAFSGSLYALAVSGWQWLGPITPFGGVALMIGWFFLMVGGWRGR
jgi:uncharacterized membrane protein YgdD (TMEM256/DUF423 family)